MVEIIIMLAIGAVAGWLAGNLMSGGGFGLIGNIGIGLAGSIVGTLIGGLLSGAPIFNGLPSWVGAIIWATIGAVLLLYIIKLIKKF